MNPMESLASLYCQRINSWKTLIQRTSLHHDLKFVSAEYFHRLLVTRILCGGVRNYFFESGSSVALVANLFRKFIEMHREVEQLPKLSIQTNNILACLEFELFGNIPVTLYPPGPPEDKYGATFGLLQERLPLPPATQTNPVTYFPQDIMKPMKDYFRRTFLTDGVVFMSASGLELNPGRFQGIHVGSYANMVFKRTLLEAGCPTVMFLDQTKIEWNGFREGTCYPVCDEGLPWTTVCTSLPFALVIGANHFELLQPVLKQLGDMGLESQKIGDKTGDFGVILANRKFEERFPEDCGKFKEQNKAAVSAAV